MSISSSSAMKLLLSLDESGATATRLNSGSLGTDHNFVPVTDGADPLTGEGCPTLSDGRNGRGAITAPNPDAFPLFTDEWRMLEGKIETSAISAHSAVPALPIADADNDFAYNARFQAIGPYTEGIGDEDFNVLWGLGKSRANIPQLMIAYQWQDDSDETLGAQVVINMPGLVAAAVDDVGGLAKFDQISGSPSEFYVVADQWYRVLVRVFYDAGAGGMLARVYVYDETAGLTYVWQLKDANASTTDWPVGSGDHSWKVGIGFDGTGAYVSAYALVDECWLYDAPLTDDEATSAVRDGVTIPWSEPDYHREEQIVYSAVTKEDAAYPKTRPLPTGATVCRHPVDVLAQEIRARLENWRAGQPWALRALDFVFDPAGPYGSQRARRGERPDLSVGVWRSPGSKPWGACEDSRNVEFTFQGPRRRRGYKIRRDVDQGETGYGFNAFYTWRDYEDALFTAYKVGSKLYSDSGSLASELSTGWSATETPVAFTLDGRLVVLSGAKRGIWNGGSTFDSLGVAAPGSIGVAAGAGGTLNDSYYYAATFYDPTSGDESGPVISAQVTPVNQKVTITLPAAGPEARFTQYRIYRTNAAGSPPNLFLLDTVTIAASVDDLGEPDGSQLLPQVTSSAGTLIGYITGEAPDTFSIGVSHRERAIYAKGGTNPERVYIAEPNEPARFHADQWFAADGPVRGVASWQGRVVVFTDNTVEIVESDFVRDADGNLNLNRTVVSRSVGAFGHLSIITYQGRIFWADRRGIFTMQGTDAQPTTQRISDLFPYINTNLGDRIVGGWNHLTRTLWWTMPTSAFQTDSARMQTQFVMPVDEPGKWYFHSLEATFVGQFDDDLNGQRFGCIDHSGIFKELESYEGDGQEGNETGTFEDEGTDDFGATPAGITSITGSIIAVEGAPGWATDEHRGKGLVLRDRSTGLLYEYNIIGNAAATLTTEKIPDALLAAGDGYFIGGILSFVQFAGHDFGSANRKVVRQVQYTFADLTKEDLYL